MQAYEYSHAAFNYSGHIYGATFFMATGFHGAHVLIGTTFLIVCLIRAYLGHFTPKQHLGFEFCAWYWHFVDVVWLFLFACIYVWGGGTPLLTEPTHNFSCKGRPRPPLLRYDPSWRMQRELAIPRGLAGRCPRCGKGSCSRGSWSWGRAARVAASTSPSPIPATALRCS